MRSDREQNSERAGARQPGDLEVALLERWLKEAATDPRLPGDALRGALEQARQPEADPGPSNEELDALQACQYGTPTREQEQLAGAVCDRFPALRQTPGEFPWEPLPPLGKPEIRLPTPPWWRRLGEWLGQGRPPLVAWGLAGAQAMALLLLLLRPGTPPEEQRISLIPMGAGSAGIPAAPTLPPLLRLEVTHPGATLRVPVVESRTLRPGDRLRVSYHAPQAGELTLLWRDASGVRRLTPEEAEASGSLKVAAGRGVWPVELPVPAGNGCGWLVGILSEQPLDPSYLEHSVRYALTAEQTCGLDYAALPGANRIEVFAFQPGR